MPAGADDPLVKASLTRARDTEVGLTPLLAEGPTPIWRGAMERALLDAATAQGE